MRYKITLHEILWKWARFEEPKNQIFVEKYLFFNTCYDEIYNIQAIYWYNIGIYVSKK